MPDEKKLRHMHIVLAEGEFNTLKKNAKQCGLTRTAYLRALIKNTPVKSRPPKELQILYAEINKIGSNINQIARSVNAGIASEEDARRGLFMLDKVYDRLNEAVGKWR